jgi:hypothetical protein
MLGHQGKIEIDQKKQISRDEITQLMSRKPNRKYPDQGAGGNTGPPKPSFYREFVGKLIEPITVFTAAIAVFAFIQLYIFIRSERPFLSISAMSTPEGDILVDRPLTWLVEFKNSGKTVGFISDFRSLTQISPGNMLARGLKEQMRETKIRGPIVPGDVHKVTITPSVTENTTMVLGQPAVDQLNKGEYRLWVLGYIQYRDRFSPFAGESTTGFCFAYNPKGDKRIGIFERCGNAEYEYAD